MDCVYDHPCKRMLSKGIAFIDTVNWMFPRRLYDNDFLDERPDFYLGRFLSMFPEELYETDLDFSGLVGNSEDNQTELLNEIMMDYFSFASEGVEELFTHFKKSCVNMAGKVLHRDIDLFLKMVKYSETDFVSGRNIDAEDFLSQFAKTSEFANISNITEPIFLADNPKSIYFCDVLPLYYLNRVNKNYTLKCPYFEPIITGKGLCYSFNALPMRDIFKSSTTAYKWGSTFEVERDTTTFRPTGYGSMHGLNFLLNSFHPEPMKRGKNFVISIKKQHNPYEIYKSSFQIKPGFAYTFKITANTIGTTERFETLDKSYRDCSLMSETETTNLTNAYSKSNCEYECGINYAKEKTGCVPWNFPKFLDDKTKFCDLDQSIEFVNELELFSSNNCECPSDCSETSLSVYDSIRELDISNIKCGKGSRYDEKTKSAYPIFLLCDLCKSILRCNNIRILAEFVDNINELKSIKEHGITDELCIKILNKNVATVKVEMATKSITKSVKDKRYTFTAQVSSLGTNIF